MIYRAAIVGCGRIGADINRAGLGSSRLGSHAAAYTSSSRVELVAACDVDPVRREQARVRWSIPRGYADAGEMCARERLDIVSVCTAPDGRRAWVGDLLSSGRVRAVLVEKPLAATIEEAEALAASAGRAPVAAAVNYVRRYVPAYRDIASSIRSGSLGRIQLVRGIYSKGILNNGSHMIDLLRLFFGEPRDVDPIGSPIDDASDPTVGFRARFGAADEAVEAVVQVVDHTACSIFELDIVGTRGRIVFDDLGHRVSRWTVEDTMATHGFRRLSPSPAQSDTGLSRGIAAAIDNLLDCVEGRAASFCTFDDARAAMTLALQVRNRAAALRGTGIAT